MSEVRNTGNAGNCAARCPYARENPTTDGIDSCTGKGLAYAEIFRSNPNYNQTVRPICLLVKREVTWDGEVLDVPPDMSDRAEVTRRAYPQAWNALFEAEVTVRGAQLARYVEGVNNFKWDNPTERPDIEGWDLAVALEAKSFLNPLISQGLTVNEAAEHFHRMQGQKLAEEVTDRVLQQQFDQQYDNQ